MLEYGLYKPDCKIDYYMLILTIYTRLNHRFCRLHTRLQLNSNARWIVITKRLRTRLNVRLQNRLNVRLQNRLNVRLQNRLNVRLQNRLNIRLRYRLKSDCEIDYRLKSRFRHRFPLCVFLSSSAFHTRKVRADRNKLCPDKEWRLYAYWFRR